MKRFILSASLILFGGALFAPATLAITQASTPQNVSPEATIHELVDHNRDVRDK